MSLLAILELTKVMTSSYPKTNVTGILCLHRIEDNRLTYPPPTKLLKKLCGDNAIKHVALVTTHWGKTKVATYETREKELKEKAWASFSKQGAKTERFDNTTG